MAFLASSSIDMPSASFMMASIPERSDASEADAPLSGFESEFFLPWSFPPALPHPANADATSVNERIVDNSLFFILFLLKYFIAFD